MGAGGVGGTDEGVREAEAGGNLTSGGPVGIKLIMFLFTVDADCKFSLKALWPGGGGVERFGLSQKKGKSPEGRQSSVA